SCLYEPIPGVVGPYLSESIPLDKYPIALVYPELIDWDQQLHVPLDFFENDEAFMEFMGLRDFIPTGDHKKGFKIQLDACAYFGEEVEMCGWLNKK
ncbi:hypothetical protein KI387_007970, partial [Taxus chinensis]